MTSSCAVRAVLLLAGVLLGAVWIGSASAQIAEEGSEAPEVLIVLDLSGSMNDWVAGERKVTLASEAIDATLTELAGQGTSAAVMGFAGECTGWPPSALDNLRQVREIDWAAEGDSLRADGGTPTDVALLGALHRLGIVDGRAQRTGSGGGTIALISDGESNGCTDPCAVASEYGAGHVTVHSIGFDLAQTSAAVEELACIANATGGVAVTVNDYESLRDEVRKLAQLRVGLEFTQVDPVGSSLDVDISLSNNLALTDAFLRIGGPVELLGTTEVVTQLGDLEPGDSRTVEYLWLASPCGSLSDIVHFALGGTREDAAQIDPIVNEPVHLTTVEEMLLHGMTERELRRRCSGLISSADANVITSTGGASGDLQSSGAIKYAGIGFASFAAALAATRKRRRQEDAEQFVESASEALGETGDVVTKTRIGIHKLVTGSFRGSQEAITLSLDKAGRLGRTVRAADDVLSFKLKGVPVAGGAIALAACAVNDPTAECLICSGSGMAVAGGAAAVAGATSFGILAVPAGIAVGAGMQFLWDRTLLADIGRVAADALGPVTWAVESALEGLGDATRAVGSRLWPW